MALSAIRPCDFVERDVARAVEPVLRKKGILRRRPVEEIVGRAEVYWPHDIVSFRFSLSDGRSGPGRALINLVSAGLAEGPKELVLSIRRPEGLEDLPRVPLPEGALAPEPMIRGIQALEALSGFLGRVVGPRSRMGKAVARAGRDFLSTGRRLVLPPLGALETIRKVGDLYARLEGLLRELNARVGLEEGAELVALEPLEQEGPVFLPSLVLTLSGPSGRRHVVLDLSGPRPRLDVELTYLCSFGRMRGLLEGLLGPK